MNDTKEVNYRFGEQFRIVITKEYLTHLYKLMEQLLKDKLKDKLNNTVTVH